MKKSEFHTGQRGGSVSRHRAPIGEKRVKSLRASSYNHQVLGGGQEGAKKTTELWESKGEGKRIRERWGMSKPAGERLHIGYCLHREGRARQRLNVGKTQKGQWEARGGEKGGSCVGRFFLRMTKGSGIWGECLVDYARSEYGYSRGGEKGWPEKGVGSK